MTQKELEDLIIDGNVKAAIDLLLDFVDKHYSRFSTDVQLIAGRYNRVTGQMRRAIIPQSDYELEMNRISNTLLEISKAVNDPKAGDFQDKKSREEVEAAVKLLEERFNLSRTKMKTIHSNPSRLREKNSIAREMGDLFIYHPELIRNYFGTQSEGIITGIANKYKNIPDLDGIDFFESVARPDLGNFTKCCIVNALAEIIYSGLEINDDKRIAAILDQIFPGSLQTVKLSITRVSGELDYFVGNVPAEK